MMQSKTELRHSSFIQEGTSCVWSLGKLLFKVKRYQPIWDRHLSNEITKNDFSPEAAEYIFKTNKRTHAGKFGNIYSFLLDMDGQEVAYNHPMWIDISTHLLAVRIVDDYVDTDDSKSTSVQRLESLHWKDILIGKLPQTYESPEQEASIKMLDLCLRRLKHSERYMTTIEALYDAVHTVESATDYSDPTIREADIVATVLPMYANIDIMAMHGYEVSPATTSAFVHMLRGGRMNDHLDDLYKDLKTKAFNPILFDAQKMADKEHIKLQDAIKIISAHYKKIVFDEFQEGSNILSGKAKIIYRALLTLIGMKLSNSHLSPSFIEILRQIK